MKAIIVLGMHRSGTSAITRAVGLLGAAMGDPQRMGKHWENIPLRKLNERLIQLGEGGWDAPPPSGWWNTDPARALQPAARVAVDEQFGDADIAVWKDPRACLTLPWWLDVFEEQPVCLLIHRHPVEVADSLASRNGFGRGHAYALWERYNADALRAAQGQQTVVVAYDALMRDPVSALAALCAALAELGVVLPGDPATTEHGLVAHERHHDVGDATAALEGAVATASQEQTHALLRELDGAHRTLTLPRPVPSPSPLSLELLDLVRANRYATRGLRRRVKRKAREPHGHPMQTHGGGDDSVDEPADRQTDACPDDGTERLPAMAGAARGGQHPAELRESR